VSIRDLHHEPSVGGIVLTLRDVTERRRLQREHEERTRVDPLTGLGNRLLFEDAVERAVLAPTVSGVLLVDVDDFRTVNDVFGRQVGDELLRAVGARLLACLDGSRTVARLDGDGFGVLVEGVGDALDVDALVGHVVDEFTAPFVVLGSTVTVRLAVGVATTDDADDAGQLLGRAGEALRAAKSRGRGHWCRYEAALHQEIVERTRLRTELADAIAGDGLVLRYRPIVELGSGRPDGFESVAGWPHPVGLTGIAEESGLVGPLGSWVLDRSIRDAVGWHHLFPDDPPHVSVRVSARQFRAPGFVEHVLTLINRHGLAPHLLTLAISGSLLLAEPDEVREDLSILRNAGLRISIDGFGAGNMSHLHRVPADVLKLDRSLVDTSRQYDLVAGIVRLARTLRLDVVAEDTGTATDRSLLHAIGCRYLIGHPMPADEVVPWLMAHLDLVPS
jgi:diguanylate cyclase (GGDEF)-like protein